MSDVPSAFDALDYGPAPESHALAVEWLDSHGRSFGHFINGKSTLSTGSTIETKCPADDSHLAFVSNGSDQDVSAAIAAARKAGPGWRDLSCHQRATHLYMMARQVQKNARLLAVLESLNNGKPIRESRDLDVPLVARHFYYHAGWAQLVEGRFPGHEPLGVVGQIIPWNFPLLMLAWKVAPALAAGNTVVLKPAELTPLTSLLFAQITAEAGLPPGVLNIVTGDGQTGAALVRHPGVGKIAFTGSTAVGRDIRIATAGSGKKLSLELGGKSPFIVFETADIDGAVEGVVDAIWFNQGEVCCAGSRLLIQESIEETFHDRLRARMETLKVGHPLDKGIDIGAIVDPNQLSQIKRMVTEGEEDGARIWQPSWAVPSQGSFYPPTLCTHVSSTSRIATDEIFGPVIVSTSFRTPSEAITLANDTRYGLAASVWTEDINLALDVAPRIRAGTVWINCTNFFDAASGFGGYRESGFGREGGIEGMWEYLKPSPRQSAPQPLTPTDKAGVRPEPYASANPTQGVDRTYKLYIGGKKKRPDSGYSVPGFDGQGAPAYQIPRGNRKDVREAVEAARKALTVWAQTTAHGRAQILYFIAENLMSRRDEFQRLLSNSTGASEADTETDVASAIVNLFTFAAWADKHDGYVHQTPFRNVTLAMNEPAGVVGIRCDDAWPLASAATALGAALSQGNAVVLLPSARFPVPALELTTVLECSDIPGGVVNLVTGIPSEVVPTLADHDDVDDLWDFVQDDLSADVEIRSAGNLKRIWSPSDGPIPWTKLDHDQQQEFLRRATRVKNIWIPYGS